jgi:hypothetical protein
MAVAYADMVKECGSAASALGQTTVEYYIAEATKEANAYLAPAGLSASGDACDLAVKKLTHVYIIIRKREDGSRPASLGIDVISINNNVNIEIEQLRKTAFEILEQYKSQQALTDSRRKYYMAKVN